MSKFSSIFKYLGSRKLLYIFILLVLSGLGYIFEYVNTFTFKNIIDSLETSDISLFKSSIINFSVFMFFYITSRTFFQFSLYSIINRFRGILNKILFKNILSLPIKEIYNIEKGDLITRLVKDIQAIEDIFIEIIPVAIESLFVGIGSLYIVYLMSPEIMLVVLLLNIISIFVNYKYGKVLNKYSLRLTEINGKIIGFVNKTIKGQKTIRSFKSEKYIEDKFEKLNNKKKKKSISLNILGGILMTSLYFISNINILVVLIISSYFVTIGKISLGSLFALITISSQFSDSLIGIGVFISEYKKKSVGIDRFLEIIDKEKEIFLDKKMYSNEKMCFDKENNEEEHNVNYSSLAGLSNKETNRKGSSSFSSPLSDVILDIKDLHFGYDNAEILKDINLNIKKGEIVTIIGESGEGKSTLLKLLLLFDLFEKGSILLNGKKITEYDLSELRSHYSYLSQDSYLFNKSIYENIRYGNLKATEEDIYEVAKIAQVDKFVERLKDGYNTIVEENSTNLSGGQKQRIAIARALLKDSSILLLDEATSSLDIINEKDIETLIVKHFKGKAIINITHKDFLLSFSDKIYRLDNKKLKMI